MIVAGCSVLQNVPQPTDGGEDDLEMIDLSGEDGDSDDSDGDFSPDDSELPLSAYIICPPNPMAMVLIVNHTWDFSPNRDLEKMKVDGKTAPFAACPLSVHGSQVTMEDCIFPFTSTGYVNTDAGQCDITASGDAILSVEGAGCDDGKITLTIIETIDTDGGTSGAMNCPNKSQPYIPFYPFSGTTRTFPIIVGGFEQTEDMDPDLSGQFKYHKEWVLQPKDLPIPESDD
jgi:hypothetical protein